MKVNFNSDVGKGFAIVTALAPTKSARSVDGNDTACTEGCACESSLFGFVVLGIAILMTACNSVQQSQPAGGTRAADEAAIRKADADSVKAAQTKRLTTGVAFYSDDAVVVPPNDKAANSKDSFRKTMVDFLALPDLSVTRQLVKLEVARSGDLAYLYGAYEMTTNGADGQLVTDRGKNLEIWKKQADGNWKCILGA
jgi:ketosteroid isomerase-like protein